MPQLQPEGRAPVRFPTTHWSRVAAAANRGDGEAREVLAMLCQAYWYPIYAFVRRRGFSPEQARDRPQDFFAYVLERELIARADPARGRFRAFLRTVCARHLAGDRDRENAAKRGGRRPPFAIAPPRRRAPLRPRTGPPDDGGADLRQDRGPDPPWPRVAKGHKPFEYEKAEIPLYTPGTRWSTLGEPICKMQTPLSPGEPIKHLVLSDGFEARLFASEPRIGKPITMTWDYLGRLYVAETVDYPNEMQPKGRGHDRTSIVEDTDGDGKADKVSLFADNLSIPTSLCHVNGGLIVARAPDMLFLRDTDGDGKVDERKVLFTGFKMDDTHAGPSNLRYGLGNWIYAIIGYAGFTGEVGGERLNFCQGFFRFKPDGSKLGFLPSNNNNSWGVGISEDGLLFGSTANGRPSVYMPIPNWYYEIELIDAEGKKHTILRDDIDELASSKKSLMPEGFEKTVPSEGLADLLQFLTRKGKYLPLDLRKVAKDVPGSKLPCKLGGQQVRYLTVVPKKKETIARIDLVKGSDRSAPIVLAATVEGLE